MDFLTGPPRKKVRMSEEEEDERMNTLLRQAEIKLRSLAETKAHQKQQTRLLPQAANFDTSKIFQPYIKIDDKGVPRMDADRLIPQEDRDLADRGPLRVENSLLAKQKKIQDTKATAGSDWYDLPKTNLTPELKRDLEVLRMRSALDPKTFYKKDNSRPKVPEFSQIGTLIEGPTEYHSARIRKADRKRTLAEEILSGERENGKLAKRYGELQATRVRTRKSAQKSAATRKYGTNLKR